MKNLILTFSLLIISLSNLNAQTSIRKKHFNIEYNLAIQGYDPVAYFTAKKAIEGKKSIATTHDGIIYYFSSQKNKDLFIKEPEKYEPQYGGWCAFAMGSYNEKVEIDPETFKIVEGKLYLFYHSFTNNTLTKWNEHEKSLKAKADKNWMNIYK
jgi:YHS domain-containing protein